MRKPRFKCPGRSDVAFYHCVSRVVNRDFVLLEAEKEKFVEYMRLYERYCGVQVVTFCVMSNHFHVLVAVPKRPEVLPTDEELILRVKDSFGEVAATVLADDLTRAKATGTEAWAEEIRQRHFCRMWDVSQFMKTLKQRFTQWFNRRHNRTGTLWEGRFHSVLVEGAGTALVAMATYIDLNPVRAGLVADPLDYRWCGYAAALGGDARAAEGLAVVVGAYPVAETDGLEALPGYRVLLFGRGVERGIGEDGQPVTKGFSREQAQKVIAEGGKLERVDYVRCRVRYFTAGAVIGSRDYVNGIFEAARNQFPPQRKVGARKVAGLEAVKGEGLYAMRGVG